jgi:hypothetical protein
MIQVSDVAEAVPTLLHLFAGCVIPEIISPPPGRAAEGLPI